MSQLTEEQRREWEEKVKSMTPEQLQELQRQQCIFCQIISAKIPSKKVYEDAVCLAILDINPAAKGHLLLLPKEHFAIMPQVPEKVLGHLAMVSKHLSQVLLKVLRADGTTVFIANGAAAGQRAQHFMVHLFPRRGNDGILKAEERLVGEAMALKVKAAIEKKLLELLGNPNPVQQIERPIEKTLEKPGVMLAIAKEEIKAEELFITSGAAKRYHKEKCAFAQNIPLENKITLSKEEAEKSGRKPCTCVSGRKIPLVKPIKSVKPASAVLRTKTKTKAETTKAEIKVKETKEIKVTKSDEKASLDDIAKLFR